MAIANLVRMLHMHTETQLLGGVQTNNTLTHPVLEMGVSGWWCAYLEKEPLILDHSRLGLEVLFTHVLHWDNWPGCMQMIEGDRDGRRQCQQCEGRNT